MGNKKNCLSNILSVLFIVFMLTSVNFVCIGFAKNGINAPISYGGGDGFSEARIVKNIIQTGWNLSNNNIGAPYSASTFDFPSEFLMNVDFLGMKFFSLFSKDPYTVFNLQFLYTFSLCGIISFIVLRLIGVELVFSILGAILYGMSPYIYSRGMGHYCLGACYFVPLSILLCVWALEDDEEYLSLKNGIKSFLFYKKNLTMILCCLLIANNGIGYYPFFTCFFLCITAIIIVFKEKNFSCMKKSIVPIVCIIFFMSLALTPVFIYKITNGSNDVARRNIAETEVYALKTTQLFIPTNKHHTEKWLKIVSEYNSQAPLINENITAYLGLFSCIGFLLSLIFSFIPLKNTKQNENIKLFSKLSIWALLFFSIGGFVTLFCLVSGIRSLRGFNRVSIFIEFMAIATLCLSVQKFFELDYLKKHRVIYKISQFLFAAFALLCIYEQHPSRFQNNNARAYYKALRQNDLDFVKKIESLLQENDAVFQLPYHKYPEAGPVRNMSDYDLFAGYINSTKLRWNYGGMKGRKSDKWNEKVSSLEMNKMIPAIVQSGFRGMYIDSRAYTSEELKELCASIESILSNEKPIISGNGFLYFYNLYPYLEQHSELQNLEIFDAEYLPYEIGETISLYGAKRAVGYFAEGLSGTEECFTWTDGNKLTMQANLQNYDKKLPIHAFIDCHVFNGTQRVNVVVNRSERIDLVAKDGTPLEFVFSPPTDGKLTLELQLPDAASPKALGISEDPRVLALALKTIVFTQGESNKF